MTKASPSSPSPNFGSSVTRLSNGLQYGLENDDCERNIKLNARKVETSKAFGL